MVGSSKKQKSSLRDSPRKSRERHVSFAVPSVGENTTHTDEEAVAPGLQPPTFVPPATQQPCGAEATSGNQNALYYGPTGASMHSSTTTLIESWSHDPFVERTTMAHGTYWVWPTPLGSRWPQIIRPFVPPEVVSEASVDDDDVDAKAARTTLRNICIASSTAAILAVFIVLVLVAEFSLPNIDIRTSEMPQVVDRFHSGDPGIAASLKHINTPEATRTAARAPTPSTSRPRRVTNRQRAFPTVPKRTAITTTRRMTNEKTSTRHPGMNKTLPHECSSHFYTYCTTAVREFYYSASSHACRSTEADRVHLCNVGSNRFPNLGSCLASCVHEGKGGPHDRCYEKALFGTCTRQDVAETWWYYNGSACTAWNFSHSKCPSTGRGVYHSRWQCERACLPLEHRRNASASAQRPCHSPVAVTCTLQQLKYPYFADMRAQGSVRCVKASSHMLRHRRCLIGSNRFDTMASCEKSCVHL